ncbi:MAG: 50S ribosomal protein L35 [Candidatus Saccharimonadales bacterium]
MPKLKTHSGTKKRVRITKTGKVMRRHTRLNHFLEKKSQSRKRRLSQTATLTGKQAKNIKRQLGV